MTQVRVRLAFAGGHVESRVLDINDPFARMEVLPLERAYGKVISSRILGRVGDTDPAFASRQDLPREMRKSLRVGG